MRSPYYFTYTVFMVVLFAVLLQLRITNSASASETVFLSVHDPAGRRAPASVEVDSTGLLRQLERYSGKSGHIVAGGTVRTEGGGLVFSPGSDLLNGEDLPSFLEQEVPLRWRIVLREDQDIHSVKFEARWISTVASPQSESGEVLVYLGDPFLIEENESSTVWEGKIFLKIPLSSLMVDTLSGDLELVAHIP